MEKSYKQFVLSLLFLIPFFCWSQILDSIQIESDLVREKLYIHFDKNDYVLGDTIWYKSYLVDAQGNMPSEKSGVVYIEFLDPENDLVKRYTHHSILGISNGFIPTDTAYSFSGIYKIRAYTSWMRNFGDTLFFEKEVRIADSRTLDKWFLSIQHPKMVGDSVIMGLRFTDERSRPLRNQAADIYLLGDRSRVAIHDRLQLDNNGSTNVNLVIPEEFRNSPLFLKITDVGNKKAVRVNAPFDISGKNLDVQFLPESGHLLAGVKNRVGFKVLGSNGLGVDVEGVIKDELGKEIAPFRSIHRGMGSFVFTPEVDRNYIAYLNNGEQVPLSKPENSGVILQLLNSKQDKTGERQDSDFKDNEGSQNDIRFQIVATSDFANQQYYLMCRSKGNTFHQQEIKYVNDPVEITLPRALFPSGVSSFVLFNKNGKIQNERAIFIDHKDGLSIQIEPSRERYGLRDSIPLKINVKDRFGNPVMGSFSLAVTDMRQVEKDPERDGTIRSYLLLQSELKGNIENPGYYFNADSTGEALDALLLTQGFVHYNWNSTQFTHKAEKEFTVSGKVVKGIMGTSPIVGTKVVLFSSKKFPMVLQTVTDAYGRFLFNDIPSFDTTSFTIQARNVKDKSFNVSVKLNHFYPAPLGKRILASRYSDRVSIDRNALSKATPGTIRYIRPISEAGLLNVVEITRKRIIAGSKNLNGPGNADQVFTLDDIKKMSSMNIYEFLKMNINGYIMPWGTEEQRMNAVDTEIEDEFLIGRDFGKVGDRPVYIFIDGEGFTGLGPSSDFRALRSENIKGIEVMDNQRFANKYNNAIGFSYMPMFDITKNMKGKPLPFFIEVTTRSGAGAGNVRRSSTPGVESYYPPVFYYGKEFYSPRYTTVINRADPLPDLRTTLYWNPLIITDEDGNATADFYSADVLTDYLIVLEGMNLKGGIGAAYKQIKIQK